MGLEAEKKNLRRICMLISIRVISIIWTLSKKCEI